MTALFLLQWKAEIQDFCPSTRILLIGCKTDLRTDVCTRMELSNQKQSPISHEQVCFLLLLVCLDWSEIPLWFFSIFTFTFTFSSPLTSGLLHGQAAWSGGLLGVLSLHIGEEHPQRFPHRSVGLHEQTAACQQTQPRPPPLQEAPQPAQQDRAPLLHLQQGQVQELLHHVNTTGIMLGRKKKKKERKQGQVNFTVACSAGCAREREHQCGCVGSLSLSFAAP